MLVGINIRIGFLANVAFVTAHVARVDEMYISADSLDPTVIVTSSEMFTRCHRM